jgi:hypothetical protein
MLRRDSIEILEEEDMKELANALTQMLRLIAHRSGWPAELIGELSVTLTDEHDIIVDYPDSLAGDIEDMEYGTLNTLPNAAIRPFMSRAVAFIEEFIEQRLVPKLMYQLGVF